MRVELRLHNTLSAKLNISNSGISSGGGGRVIWGNIVGEIENQEDLVAYIDSKGYLTSIPSEYVTETDLLGYQPIGDYLTSIPEEYVKRPELDSYQPKGDYLTAIPSEYITEEELEGKNYAVKSEIPTTTSALTNDSGYLTEHQDISGLATKEELSGYQIKGNYLTEIPEDYAKKSDIPDTSKFITEIPSEYITETELGDKGYATEAQLTSALGDIESVLNNIIGG